VGVTRGSSGARVYGSNGVVRKVGTGAVGERVALQGRWLLSHRGRSLPRVTRAGDTGYDMEPLLAAPAWALDHDAIFTEMLTSLNSEVWKLPAEVPYDEIALLTKVGDLCHRFELRTEYAHWRELHAEIDFNALQTGLAHGDPTFDNVMFRESTGDLVLVDPLPSLITGPAIPDLRCVDLGKILQSVLGWERIRYGDDSEAFKIDTTTFKLKVAHSQTEWQAVVLFGITHLLRTLPYVADPQRRDQLRGCIRVAFTLV
jgi:hypothetical protein